MKSTVVSRRGLIGASMAAGVSALAGCSDSSADGDGLVIISDPWVRSTVDTQDPTMTAAFMDLANPGPKPVTLVKASCAAAKMTQLHVMQADGDKQVMVEAKDGLRIEAGSHKHLVSGGAHIMLMGVTKPLAVGDEVTIELTFDSGQVETITAVVKEFVEEEDHYHSPSPSNSVGA